MYNSYSQAESRILELLTLSIQEQTLEMLHFSYLCSVLFLSIASWSLFSRSTVHEGQSADILVPTISNSPQKDNLKLFTIYKLLKKAYTNKC